MNPFIRQRMEIYNLVESRFFISLCLGDAPPPPPLCTISTHYTLPLLSFIKKLRKNIYYKNISEVKNSEKVIASTSFIYLCNVNILQWKYIFS